LREFDERSLLAVRRRLVSDVPLGVFLSGGIDSSFILAQAIAAGAPTIETFAIGFPESRYDERAHAAKVAAALGSTHHEAEVDHTDLVQMLPELVHHYGEPFADSSMVPTFYLARWARQRITVALTGEGGDELFAGYYRHQAARLAAVADRLPAPVRLLAGVGAGQIGSALAHPMSTRHKAYRFLRAIELDADERYTEWTAPLSAAERAALVPGLATPGRYRPPGLSRTTLDRALAVDLARTLPDQLLVKMDIATMANSLEARAPLLDFRLVEWAARLPVAFKQRGRTRKRLIADALAAVSPSSCSRGPRWASPHRRRRGCAATCTRCSPTRCSERPAAAAGSSTPPPPSGSSPTTAPAPTTPAGCGRCSCSSSGIRSSSTGNRPAAGIRPPACDRRPPPGRRPRAAPEGRRRRPAG
jgi:asparagine synthase (glutamine-hydrolysing)